MRDPVRVIAMAALVAWTAAGALAREDRWRVGYVRPTQHVMTNYSPIAVVDEPEIIAWSGDLLLTPQQRMTVIELAAGADREYREAWLRTVERADELEDPGSPMRRWEMWQDLHQRFLSSRRSVLDDLELILDDVQRDRWPDFERRQARRELFAIAAEVPPHPIDLVVGVSALGLEEEAEMAIDATLRAYNVAIGPALASLDAAITRLDRAGARHYEERLRLGAEGIDADEAGLDRDPKVLRAAHDMEEASARIEAVNAKHVKLLLEDLPTEAGRDLRGVMRFGQRPGDRTDGEDMLRGVSMLGDTAQAYALWGQVEDSWWSRRYTRMGKLARPLDRGQHERLEAIRARYQRDLTALRQRHGFLEGVSDANNNRSTARGRLMRVYLYDASDEGEASDRDAKALERYEEDLEELDEKLRDEVYAILDMDQRILFRMEYD